MGTKSKHYFRNGTLHTGSVHKMPNGQLHSGARHGKNSKRLYHFSELSDTAKKKAKAATVNLSKGGSTVNSAGNYTQPEKRKRIFNRIKAGTKGGGAGQWSARKAQMLAKAYKAAGGGYKS